MIVNVYPRYNFVIKIPGRAGDDAACFVVIC